MNRPSAFIAMLVTLASVGSLVLSPIAAEAKAKPVVKAKKRTLYHLSISAIPGKDEKNFDDPSSRCLTPAMYALNAVSVKHMNADIEKFGTGHDAAVETYKEKMATIWSAMEQPYCGFGSRGLAAVKHSFQKSVERTRAEFLKAVK